MFGINNLQTQTANLIREGVVSEVLYDKHACRVTFPDKNNLVSAELPVLTGAAFKNKSYNLPDIGERVVVLMAGNAGTSGAGYVVGGLYTGENPPSETANNYALKFSDEAEVRYKRADKSDKTSAFKMTFADKTEMLYECGGKQFEFCLKFSDGCQISYNNNAEFEIKFKDGATITHARGDLEIDVKGEINITASGDVNIKGANIHLN